MSRHIRGRALENHAMTGAVLPHVGRRETSRARTKRPWDLARSTTRPLTLNSIQRLELVEWPWGQKLGSRYPTWRGFNADATRTAESRPAVSVRPPPARATGTSINPHFSLPIRTVPASIKAYLAGRPMSVAKADTVLACTATERKNERPIGDGVVGARRIR